MIGAGKYDELCTQARLGAKAKGAILIVLGGEHGNGFSGQFEAGVCVNLPSILREVAGQIEADLAKGTHDCTEKLLAALRENNAPPWLIILAENNAYHDFKSESATPCVDLVRDLEKAGLHNLARRAMNGEFDATKEESDSWAKEMAIDPEMGPLLKKLGLDK